MVDDTPARGDDAGDQHHRTTPDRPLKLALELVGAGYFVAPVVIRRDPRTGKKLGDYLGIRWHDQSTLDPDQVRDWWAQHQCSFLVDTGRSGVFVPDLDVPPTGETGEMVWRQAGLPLDTLTVRTPGGGLHLYWRAPAGESLTVHKRIHGHPIDVRGDGGHVYAPGSVVLGPGGVPELRGYELDGPLVPADRLAELPGSVAAFLHASRARTAKTPTAQGEVRTRSAVLDILRAQLDRISDAPAREGTGFRGVVLGAAMCFGRAVAAGMTTEAGAARRLEERVARVWGSVDADDRRWIRHGLQDGQEDPWTVVPDDYDTTVSTVADRDRSSSTATGVSTPVPSSLSNGGADVEPESVRPDPGTHPDAPDDLAELEEADSWAPAPAELVAAILAGTVAAPEPAVGVVREDGHPFLYPGLEHAVIGEMEAGKSWFALACVAAELRAGRRVGYLHFEESDPTSTYLRLARQFAVPADVLLSDRFWFVGPERRISASDVDRLLAPGAPSLVVLDGVNEAMALHGMGIFDADGAADFRRRLVKPWKRAGAAVLSLDHVAKSEEGRSSGYAYGAVGKGNGLDGAMLQLENAEPFGDGRRGVTNVYVTKDRHGQLRKLGRPKESRTSAGRAFFVGRMVIDASTPGVWRFEFVKPAPADQAPDPEVDFLGQERKAAAREAELDAAVLAAVTELDANPNVDSVSGRKVVAHVKGFRAQDVRNALERLQIAGRIKDSSAHGSPSYVPMPAEGASHS
jgi:bifunctional DNA primase/polymerase-like protein